MSGKHTVQRTLKIVTESALHPKSKKTKDGLLWRKWQISIYGVNEAGENYIPAYLEKVDYLLHPTFKSPTRTKTSPPFTLTEQGWGEFDIGVRLYFVDKNVKHDILIHDLHFKSSHYEVNYPLIFENPTPSFLQLLDPPSSNANSPENGKSGRRKSGGKRRDSGDHERIRAKKTCKKAPASPNFAALDNDNESSDDGSEKQIDLHKLRDFLSTMEDEETHRVFEVLINHYSESTFTDVNPDTKTVEMDLMKMDDNVLSRIWEIAVKFRDY
ncbi:uncharacterized protein VTP21DRAFT_64 [Calcarisporiella thermophila]|uniref:uncharacterized protein n=1 Tax=Calcarisporiella thermophila TaxID=911321 RepID=UPI0037449A8C